MNSFKMIFVSSCRVRGGDWFGIFSVVAKMVLGMVFVLTLFTGFPSCASSGPVDDASEEEEDDDDGDKGNGESEDDAGGSISGILLNSLMLDLPATASSREITLTARLENISDETQGVTVTFYRSTDPTISTQDMMLGDPVIATLPARQSGQTPPELSSSYTIPSGDTRYSYGYCVSTSNGGGACARSNVALEGVALVKTRLDATCPARDNSVGSTTQLDTTTTSISYTLTFNRRWSAATHPTNYPPSNHFTTLVGAAHHELVVFWRRGEFASAGVEGVAEFGTTSTFSREITAEGDNAVAATDLSGSSSATLTVSQAHPLVTMISMLAPSPDWFIGIGGLDMRVGGSTDTFYNEVTVSLRLYDAGTQAGDIFRLGGTGDTGVNADMSLRERITRLSTGDEDTDFGNNNNPEGAPCLGTFTITKQ